MAPNGLQDALGPAQGRGLPGPGVGSDGIGVDAVADPFRLFQTA